jgi:hypothetical protein
MMLVFPFKSGRRWIPVAIPDYATPLQGTEPTVAYRLEDLAGIIEPIIADHWAGEADQATTRFSIQATLRHIGDQPYLEIGGVRQDIDDEWLDVVIKTNTDVVCGYRSFAQSIDPEILEAYPAWELVKAKNGEEPCDWKTRWAEFGGQMHHRRMIALKNDPVWLRISDFGHSHPPFAFGSGMDVTDISRVEAVELGLTGWRSEIQVPPCPICSG